MLNEHKKFWKDDVSFMLWLLKQMIVLFLKGDTRGSEEAWYFIRLHWNYKSEKVH